MKLINCQCFYLVDDEKYPYIAFDLEGRLRGFKNLPVRNFQFSEWVDCVTGDTGEQILFDKWDQSMRESKELFDTRIIHTRKGKKLPTERIRDSTKKRVE
jgi:hypothetical protein